MQRSFSMNALGAFHARFYNYTLRLRLKKLLCPGLSRIYDGNFKPKLFLDPAVSLLKTRRFQKRNGRYYHFGNETVTVQLKNYNNCCITDNGGHVLCMM
jgi:hypothetical protein